MEPNERVFKELPHSVGSPLYECRNGTFRSDRHTNAVQLLENGADIYTVSKRLGHKEIRRSKNYAYIVNQKIKQAALSIFKLN